MHNHWENGILKMLAVLALGCAVLGKCILELNLLLEAA